MLLGVIECNETAVNRTRKGKRDGVTINNHPLVFLKQKERRPAVVSRP